MANESVLKMILSNRINSGNLDAAINAQKSVVNGPHLTTFSTHFVNRTFSETGYRFNIHLHTGDSSYADHPAEHNGHTTPEQRETVLEYVRRPDISILIINAILLKPAWRFYSGRDIAPGILLGELLAILQERYATFRGSPESGMIILSTGDMDGQGSQLESYLLEMAHLNNLEPEFLDWIENSNFFCNILTRQLVSLCNNASRYMPVLLSVKDAKYSGA